MHEPDKREDDELGSQIVLLLIALIAFVVVLHIGLGKLAAEFINGLMGSGFPPFP